MTVEDYRYQPTLTKGPDDLFPIDYDERNAQEVITDLALGGGDETKKFWENLKVYQELGHTNDYKVGYQYDPKYKRPFPFTYEITWEK
jgi:hypothetical protein